MEAVILAGGFGTRLQSVVNDVPKPMAPIGDKPFLSYILNYLQKFDVTRVILSTGYKHEVIERFYGNQFQGLKIEYVVENEPLGTGGAIKCALKSVSKEDVLVLNGDTLFRVDLHKAIRLHNEVNADLTFCLKPMHDFERYGTVLREGNRITGFHEKQYKAYGEINGGVYICKKNLFDNSGFPEVFSFEKDLLEKQVGNKLFYAYPEDAYFIDIGIPEDYQRAQRELLPFYEE